MNLQKLPPFWSTKRSAIAKALGQHPLVRSLTYASCFNLLGLAASYIVNPRRNPEWSMGVVLANHTLAAPFMFGLTYGFVTLRTEDQAWWRQVVLKRMPRQLLLGIALGSSVYLTTVAAASALNWVHFEGGGWIRASKTAVAWTLISHLGNVFVAWNEEMLYRGYGLQSLAEVVGLPGAVAVLVPLFARGHGAGWQVFIGQSALALAMTALRLAGNSLWLPVGFHAAWNYMQTAVLGAPDAMPSLVPMHVHGPTLWMGRPGYPVPGLLSIVANLTVAAGAALLVWRARRQALPSNA